MDLEELKIKRNRLIATINRKDDLSYSFVGGRVGFKSGVGLKKHERGVYKLMQQMRKLKALEEQIERIENPTKRSINLFVEPSLFEVGNKVRWFGVLSEVIKINKKTVTIQTESGYKESVKASLIVKV